MFLVLFGKLKKLICVSLVLSYVYLASFSVLLILGIFLLLFVFIPSILIYVYLVSFWSFVFVLGISSVICSKGIVPVCGYFLLIFVSTLRLLLQYSVVVGLHFSFSLFFFIILFDMIWVMFTFLLSLLFLCGYWIYQVWDLEGALA